MQEKKIAILFFARTPREEAKRKKFTSFGKFNNYNIAKYLHKYSLSVLKKSGFPYYHYSEQLQRGEKFSERWINAVENIFEKDIDALIVVGNDCPELNINDIQKTAAKLNFNDVVAGPCSDGGAYILGLARRAFDNKKLMACQWQTEDFLNSLEDYANLNSLSYATLGVKYDIDSEYDIFSIILRNDLISKFKNFIKGLFLYIEEIVTNQWLQYIFAISKLHLRAPPFRV